MKASLKIPFCFVFYFILFFSPVSTLKGINSVSEETPTCIAPNQPACFVNNFEEYIILWNDVAAQYNYTRYEIRYKPQNNSAPWQSIFAFSGYKSNLGTLQKTVVYVFEIRKICDGAGDVFSLASSWITVPIYQTPFQNDNGEPNCDLLNAFSITSTPNEVNIAATINNGTVLPSIKIQLCNPSTTTHFLNLSDYVVISNNSINLNLSSISNLGFSVSNICHIDLNYYVVINGVRYAYCDDVTWDKPSYSNGCGTSPISIPPSQDDLKILLTGDILFINQIPFQVDYVQGDGVWSGKGHLMFPIGGLMISSNFTNLKAKDNYSVYSGNIIALNSVTKQLPTPQLGQILTCISPVIETSDTSSYGFDANGNYVIQPPYEGYEPPMPFDPEYDPNGFNSSGIHVNTGTAYNEDGCNVDGLDINGNPCVSQNHDPYYWLINQNETTAGLKFVKDKADLIESLLLQYLNYLDLRYQDSILAVLLECEDKNEEVKNTISQIGLDPKLVGGNDDVFLSENMSLQFTRKPQKLVVSSSSLQSESQKDLEKNYLLSYDCDVKLNIYRNFSSYVTNLHENGHLLVLEYVLGKAKKLDSIFIDKLENQDSLYKWIGGVTNKFIKNNYDFDLGFDSPKEQNSNFRLFPDEVKESSLCSSTDGRLHENTDSFAFPSKDYLYNFLIDKLNKGNFAPPGEDETSLLPLEVTNLIGGTLFSIWIDDVKISIDSMGCTFDAYLYFRIPSTGQDLIFKGENIRFNQFGAAIDKLILMSTTEVKVSNNLKLILNANNTFAKFDCSGYKSLTISADLEFCRTYLTPVNPDTYQEIPDENVKVRGHFGQITITSWKDFFIGDISIDAFAVTKFPQFAFKVKRAAMDLSSTISPTGIILPKDYISPYAENSTLLPSWKGVYVNELDIVSKQKFNQGDSTLIIEGRDMLFDNMGFTGYVSLKREILKIEKGRIGNWAFSIDSIVVQFVCNNLKGGGFGGKILLPIAGSPSETDLNANAFKYMAFIGSNGRYAFSVTTGQKFKAGLWLADVTLCNSTIDIFDNGNDVKIIAKLNGELKINPDQNFTDKSLTVGFSNLIVKNEQPYVTIKEVIIKDTIDIGFKGFKLAFFDIGAKVLPNDKVDFSFSSKIEIIGGALKIGAGANLSIIGSFTTIDGRHQWKHDNFKINGVNIDASLKGKLSVKGALIFYEDDAHYGTGFYGSVKLDVMKKFKVDAVAQFGKMKNEDDSEKFRYFLVDAFVTMENSPIIFMGMQMYGFGGGVFYNMKREGELTSLQGSPRPFGIGKSISGIKYIPEQGVYSFKAAVALALASNKKLLSINASLEMQFSNQGGEFSLDAIYFEGNGRLLTAPKFLANIQKLVSETTQGVVTMPTALSADLKIAIILGSDPSMDGSLEVYLNVGNVLKGVGPNGSMGKCRLVVSKKDSNFIYIGTPLAPLGITIKVGEAVEMTSTMYLCIGDPIPNAFPPLPDEIAELDNLATSLISQRSGDEIRNAGVMFGFCIKGDINAKWGPLKGYLNFGIGADFAFKHYKYNNGDVVRCTNNDNEEIGINGFYATGQIYAWASGSAKLFGTDLGSFSIKALLKAGGPNPTYGYARLKVHAVSHHPFHGDRHKLCVNISADVDVQFGEECQFGNGSSVKQNTPDELIVGASPGKFENDVPTTSDVVVNYAMEINKSINLPDYNGNPHQLFLKTERFEVKTLEGQIVYGTIKTESNGKSQRFVTNEGLPSNKTIILTVQATATVDGVDPQIQIRIDTFYTGSSKDTLNSNMISYYEPRGNICLYKETQSEGKMVLKPNKMNAKIFVDSDDDGFQFVIEYHKAGTNIIYTLEKSQYKFNKDKNELVFKIPDALEENAIYKLVFKRRKIINNQWNGPYLIEPLPAPIDFEDLPSLNPYLDPAITYGPINEEIKWEFSSLFRVSNYGSFEEKFNDFVLKITNSKMGTTGTYVYSIPMLEPFTDAEREFEFVKLEPINCNSFFDLKEVIWDECCINNSAQPELKKFIGVYKPSYTRALESSHFSNPNSFVFDNVKETLWIYYIDVIYKKELSNNQNPNPSCANCSSLWNYFNNANSNPMHMINNRSLLTQSDWKLEIKTKIDNKTRYIIIPKN